ncbi:unnamed protein product, partial [Meganyctiphanes norvegica]
VVSDLTSHGIDVNCTCPTLCHCLTWNADISDIFKITSNMSFAAGSLDISEAAAGSISFDEYEWQSDYDREVRKCNVYLWARCIEGWNTSADITQKHWSLVFEWDDRIATYEANDTRGYLL